MLAYATIQTRGKTKSFFYGKMMGKKFNNLLERAVRGNNFVRAYHSVLRNKGAAGVDGVKTEDLPHFMVFNWERIKGELLSEDYRPQAVRGVKIPKPNGGTRQLGIPTTIDRLIQQALHQVLSPIWEQEFSAYSYGFRPKRTAHQALHQATAYINAGRHWIIDLDLKSFFDRVNHDKLMVLISRKVVDKKVLRLIRRYLKSGMMQGGITQKRLEGTPQGGPLSPLLSNILLNELDWELEKRGPKFVRYADDCSIFLTSRRAAERVLASITRFLEKKLHLEVNQEKTTICRPVHFVLLGHSFVPTYKKGEKGKYRLSIAKKSWQRLKQKIKIITRKTVPMSAAERIEKLNRLMYGWVNYFKYATGYQKFKELDSWIRCRLRYCIWKAWKKPKRRLRAFIQLGITPSWARRFAYSRKGGWAIACSPIMGVSVTEERLRQRGYIPFLEYYLKAKYGNKTKKK
jgi:group II intron reverse transcriptase/maturase